MSCLLRNDFPQTHILEKKKYIYIGTVLFLSTQPTPVINQTRIEKKVEVSSQFSFILYKKIKLNTQQSLKNAV